jgi:hypothetical protein
MLLTLGPRVVAAMPCDVKAVIPAARIFASQNAKGPWREYREVKDVPELDLDGGKSAQVWDEKGGTLSAYTVEPGEDFWAFTRFCFDNSGQLLRVGYELRTAWGWGYRSQGHMVGTVLRSDSALFFNTESGKPIPQPDGANDVPDALRPTLYLRVDKLPFAHLLRRSPETVGTAQK